MTVSATSDAIAQTNRRRGRNRPFVLEILARAQKPLGAIELLDLLREDGLHAALQVYRALKHLIDDGTVHKIETLSALTGSASVARRRVEKFL